MFGAGALNPTNIFPAGTYDVRLTATNAVGSTTNTKTGYIIVTAPVAPTAAFTTTIQTGTAPLIVQFTDKSTGTAPLTYAWDFKNDGTSGSSSKSPSFNYSAAGTYSVKLTVTNIAGTNSTTRTDYIIVTAPVAPTAAFTANVQTGTSPLTVRFTDQSTHTPTSWKWEYRIDGGSWAEFGAGAQNPSKIFPAGTYDIRLTTTNTGGSDTKTETGFITVTEKPPGSSDAGVAITFDDNAVDSWYAIRPLLNQYNAHVTFFVSNFGSLSDEQVNKLKTLKADGHEIAYHSYTHVDADDYLTTHSIQEYLDNEILNGIGLMDNKGLKPVDFAYPYGSENNDLTDVLDQYFLHIRGIADGDPLKSINSVYYQHGSNTPLIHGVGTDESRGYSTDEIYDGISRAKDEEKIIIFYSHTPVDTNNPGSYQISYGRLENILAFVKNNDLKFYIISELD